MRVIAEFFHRAGSQARRPVNPNACDEWTRTLTVSDDPDVNGNPRLKVRSTSIAPATYRTDHKSATTLTRDEAKILHEKLGEWIDETDTVVVRKDDVKAALDAVVMRSGQHMQPLLRLREAVA